MENIYSKDEILEMYYEMKKEYDSFKNKDYEHLLNYEYEKADVIKKYINLKKRFNYLKKKEKEHTQKLWDMLG